MVAYGTQDQGFALQAATPAAGFALQNGTPSIISWTAPADGANHRFLIAGEVNVSSAETGGQIKVAFTDPAGNAHTTVLTAGGSGGGLASLATVIYLIQSGSTVTVEQTTALSVGAAVAWAEIWGS